MRSFWEGFREVALPDDPRQFGQMVGWVALIAGGCAALVGLVVLVTWIA